MEPISRVEHYLAQIAGDDVQLPTPYSREEMYLARIAAQGMAAEELSESIAPEYDDTATYSANDMVMHEGKLYICLSDIETAEEWDEDHWDEAVVGEELTKLYGIVGTAIPTAPDTDGVYVLTCTVADGAATYSWEEKEEQEPQV